MPPSFCVAKQNPVIFHEKAGRPLKATGNSASQQQSSSIPACDKSTATCSTTELSFSSIASTSTSFSKLISSKSSADKTSTTTTKTTTTTANRGDDGNNNNSLIIDNQRLPSRCINAPVTLNPHSSLLDMTMDESHDDDTSFDHKSSSSPHKASRQHPPFTPSKSKASISTNSTATTTSTNNSASDLGSSIIEQTEKNLAAISESMSSSLCANQDNVNSCSIMPECSRGGNFMSTNNTLFGDTLVQNRLLDDFTYLLGSNVMPCCEEKTIFSSCFGVVSCSRPPPTSSVHDEFNVVPEEQTKVRNRAGESWRARAYRIRKLREERMMNDDDKQYLDYSLSNRRQISMERAIGKSHSADGRIDSRNPFTSVKKNLFHSSSEVGSSSGAGCGGVKGKSRRPKHEVQSDPLGRMIGDCIDPISPVKEDAVELEVVWKQNDLDLCYDSDPGETSFRKSLTGGKNKDSRNKKTDKVHSPKRFMGRNKSLGSKFGKRRRNRYSSLDCQDHYNEEKLDLNGSFDVHVSFENDTDDEESDDESCLYDSISQPDDRPWFKRSPKLHQVRTKALQEDIGISQNVQNALNRTWTLTWHPIDQIKAQEKKTKMALLKTLGSTLPVSPEAMTQSPRAVRLWFERGNRIRGNNIVEPKLMWRDAYHPELSTHRKLNDSVTNGPNQICLLSICRILDVKEQIDRQLYPFAKKTCSFLIRTCDDEEYLFESQSEKERDELVYHWKLVVARLASQAVVGDGDKMVGEFFVPSTFGVP